MTESHRKNRILEYLVVGLGFAIPIAFFFYYPHIPAAGEAMDAERIVATFDPSPMNFTREPLTPAPEFGQLYTNVQLIDAESGGGLDVVATDSRTGRLVRLTRKGEGDWSSQVLNPDKELPGPGHVTPIDLDKDGDLDFLVSCIGGVQPTNDLVGRVVWFENDNGTYKTRDILKHVRRVTDAQGGDFDNDGDIDLVVAVFGGLLTGEILYLENNGNQEFTDYELIKISGTIHVPVADFDGDGDLDFAAIVSQEEEEVIAFENPGDGFKNAKRHWIFSSWNFDLGTAGMVANDLDQDGDQDLIIPIGDNLELINNAPQPWHGVRWLENKGDWKFEEKKIADIGGVYGVSPSDLDNDGDTDIAVVTMFNDWSQEGAGSVLWLENDGSQNFKTWQIASDPIQLATVACGDVNQDGKNDIVTGSFHFRKPSINFGSVDAFLQVGNGKSSEGASE